MILIFCDIWDLSCKSFWIFCDRLFTPAGIKFIPLRTTGGELIPESGLFVRINKEEVEEIQLSSLRSAKLRRQAELNDEDDPKTLSIIAENEEDVEALPDDVDVMQSINPIAFNQRRPKSPSNPRPVSSPPLLKSYSAEDKDAQKEEINLNKVVVVVDVNGTGSEVKAVEETDFQTQDSNSQTQISNSVTSSSKPRSLIIEANPETSVHTNEEGVPVKEADAAAEAVKEYHLQVKSGEEEKLNIYWTYVLFLMSFLIINKMIILVFTHVQLLFLLSHITQEFYTIIVLKQLDIFETLHQLVKRYDYTCMLVMQLPGYKLV